MTELPDAVCNEVDNKQKSYYRVALLFVAILVKLFNTLKYGDITFKFESEVYENKIFVLTKENIN